MRRLVRELIETVLLSIVILLALEFSLQNYRVEGSSMFPTLVEGEHLIVNKLVYARVDRDSLASTLTFPRAAAPASSSLFVFRPPQHGEVIIFRYPNNRDREFVKRVIGVPGDHIEIQRGEVIRNGEPVDEPYVIRPSTRSYSSIYIPPGSYYVLGDNRIASNDSRSWGLVPESDIVGRAWFSYWPYDTLGSID